jgi:hypothetical protein
VQTNEQGSAAPHLAGLEHKTASLSLWDEMMLGKLSSQQSPAEKKHAETQAGHTSHGVANSCSDGAPDLPPDTQGPAKPTNQPIALPRGSYRLILQIIGAADKQDAQAKHRWPKFVAAMLDAGFVATEGAGSAVSFEATDGSGSISFHKPHPDPTVYSVPLRCFGKRMTTWFGWAPERFVVGE